MIGARVSACLLAALALGCDASQFPEGPSASDDSAAIASGPASRAEPAREAKGVDSFVDSAVKTPAEYLREPAFAEADLGRGELLSYACRACHALYPDERNPLGPNLSGVFGRRAGSTSFEYSAALRAGGLVWTPAALDAWLAQPQAFIPGNNMAFTGYRAASDRRDLIAYLLRETTESK